MALFDEEFPPLGALPKDKRPVDSFGFLIRSHLPSDSQSAARSGTPTLPPGLPLPHAHPASTLLQSPLNPSSPIGSISGPPPGLGATFPALGSPPQTTQESISRPISPEKKHSSTRAKNASEISLGSPVSKSASKARAHLKTELSLVADKKGSHSKLENVNENKAAPPMTKGKPMKLDINMVHASDLSSKAEPPSHTAASQTPGPPSIVGSRPNTPMTGVSRTTSDSPPPRQPRVLRVVDTPKAETPPPMSATHSVASFPPLGKVRSRRPSISSQSRPDTPGDLGSEADLYTSTSVSRTNSPPPSSRIGSAPVRAITKSQAKKERRQKAKDAEAKKQETTTVSEEAVQAPILGRKRKAKKTTAVASEAANTTVETASEPTKSTPTREDVEGDRVEQRIESVKKEKTSGTTETKDLKPNSTEGKPTTHEKQTTDAWRSKNTVQQLMKDTEANGIPVKELFSERTSPLQHLLSQLHKSGDLNLNHHPLFNPTNLNQRFDMKCTPDDYDALKQPIELTEQHRKALMRGESIRVNSDSNLLKSRCLISPFGCILRHLSPEEEARYLALEKNVSWRLNFFQEYPTDPITEPDATNRGGGLDALFATPENFNLCWVDETSGGLSSGSPTTAPHSTTDTGVSSSNSPVPPNILSAMEADSTRTHNWAIANTAELVNATATTVRSFAAATAKHMLGAAGVVMGGIPDLDDVVGMTDEELRSFAVKSQKDLESSRKELDAIDKKLNALVKRNRKLAQQALAT